MRISRAALVLLFSLLWPAGLLAQSAFTPLDQWAAAVESGKADAIAVFYSTNPAAEARLPSGVSQDPAEEPHFWAALAAKGISNLDPKILEIDRSQPGMVLLVLRIEYVQKTDMGGQAYVIGASQAWLQEGNVWRIAGTQRSDPHVNPPRRLPEPAKPNTSLYAPPEEARSEIDAALAEAAKDHKRVILVFGANWCYDCHVLDATFHSKDIAPLVEANYHVVHVNVGEEDKNLDLVAKYGVPLNKGIPALAVLDPDGKVVYTQKQGEFEDSVKIGPADVIAFLEKWRPAKSN